MLKNLTATVFLAACAALSLLAGCGGGTEIRFGNPPPAIATGTLNVTIGNLPAGADAAVRVSGPGNYSRDLQRSTGLVALVPGSYTITALPVAVGGVSYSPAPLTQTVTVTANASAQASVQYSTGALVLDTRVLVQGLAGAVFLAAPANDPRQFIVTRAGRIRIVQNGVLLDTPFLDISSRVSAAGEGGLLSMAFDPEYGANGDFFIYYTNADRDIVVERHRVSPNDPNVAEPGGVEVIRIPHPGFTNHYGGLVAFGPDNFLYLATGDGGGAGDPSGNAQNPNVLLGKMLRLDVRQYTPTSPYHVPASNPFVGQAGVRPEIWALGLRNPWRFTFDSNVVYIADVGQNQREEVNIASAGQAGLNYGWDIMEGTTCFEAATCNREGLQLPMFEYPRGEGGSCSIVGGYVYRGAALPELRGHYFYSDYCAGFLRSLLWERLHIAQQATWAIPDPGHIVSFGEDGARELYLIAENGTVYKIVRKSPP